MDKLSKTLTIQEAVDLSYKNGFEWLCKFLSVFPNNFGINLCAVESMTFECENDEYGQLTDLHVKFIPTHDPKDYEGIKFNGGPWPWLIENDGKVNFRKE